MVQPLAGKYHFAAQKSERPVGAPAALAWGMEGMTGSLVHLSLSGGIGRSTALASSRTTHRNKITTIIPPASRVEPYSQSQG